MQRLLIALMAIGSLLMSNPATLRAQDDGKAVDPSRGTQAIDEPAASPHSGPASQPHMGEHTTVHNTVQPGPPMVNDAAARLAVIHATAANHIDHRVPKQMQHSWCGSQLALLILGLLGAGLAVIAVPNATRRVADHVTSNPKRDFQVGAFVGLGMLTVLFANAILLKLPLIKMLWAPIGIMVAFAPLLLLGFGWLAAMRCAGDCVARKLNHSGEGSAFGRMSLGLFAFFILNVFLGTVSHGLGVIGLCVEIAVALMGLGATAVIAAGSGFGRKS